MSTEFWLWLDTIAMAAGGLAILAIGKQRTANEQAHTIYHGIVPIIAACSYFAMAVGQGAVILGANAAVDSGRLFYYARYIDWAFTTPLLLLALAVTGLHSGLRRGAMITGLLLADLLMIVTALFFGASEVDWIKWTWFIISSAAFLAVYYVMWGPMLREVMATEIPRVQADYRRNAVILSVLWFLYPIILAVSTDGLSLISATLSVALIAVLDFVSKVAYGLLAVSSNTKLVTDEEGGRSTEPVRARQAA